MVTKRVARVVLARGSMISYLMGACVAMACMRLGLWRPLLCDPALDPYVPWPMMVMIVAMEMMMRMVHDVWI